MINFNNKKSFNYPFDYFILDNCFEEDTFTKLIEEWPSNTLELSGNNVMGGRRQVANLKAFEETSPTWKKLYDYLNTDAILSNLKNEFKNSMEHWGCTLTENDTLKDNNMYLHIDWSEAGDDYVREVHADSAKRYINFLIFFNDKEWDGGDFLIHSSDSIDTYFPPQSGYRDVYPSQLVPINRVIEAKKNTGIFFLSSPNSLHSVNKQSNTKNLRKFIYGAYSRRNNNPVFTNYENRRVR